MRSPLRELGVKLGTLEAGPTCSILDVPGTRVGHVTHIRGDGPLVIGQGPVRTGVTAVLPPGGGPWRAATHVINGYGKTLGLMQIDELGTLDTPIFLTNTLSVGAVQQGYLAVLRERGVEHPGQSVNVVVGECNDGFLNDLWGLHVHPDDVSAVLASGSGQTLEQGSVGAGTGMAGFGYKGGIGSASRRLPDGSTLAAAVLLNCGRAGELRLDGMPVVEPSAQPGTPDGSIIILIASDAGMDAATLRRVMRRTTHGLARTGAISAPHSGDVAMGWDQGPSVRHFDGRALETLFLATVEATEEAIWNALATAESMDGRDGHRLPALSVDAIWRAWRQRV